MTPANIELVSVTLATARIVAEEKFDAEAASELRVKRALAELPAIKQHLIQLGRLYRLTIRGRSYLASIPVVGSVHGTQLCAHWQTVTLLESLADLLNDKPQR